MLWVFILVLIVLHSLYKRYKFRRIIEVSKIIKSDIKCYPFVGHAYLFAGDGKRRMQSFETLGREAIKQGGITSLWMGGYYMVVIVDAADLEVVLKNALKKDDMMRFPRMLVGNGIVFAPVPIWRPRRKVLAPTFTPKNLNSFVNVFSKQSNIMVEQMRPLAGEGPVSVWKYLTSYAMDSVCETALGVEVSAQTTKDEPFLHAFEECCKLLAARMLQPWLQSNTVYKLLPHHAKFEKYKSVLWGFVDKVIKTKRKAIKENNNVPNHNAIHDMKTFLELLIESSGSGRGYSDLELREETLVIVLAGTDTSAVGASFALSMLARHLDIQELVYQELLEVFGESDRPVASEDLPRLKYLDAVIRETLRLYPPAPIVVRQVVEDLKLPSGITLPKYCGVMVHIWGTHRNPRYWGDDAEVFRPERFINEPAKHPAAFVAFSHGPRNCLGYQYAMMSMKTAVANILRRYRVSTSDASTINGCKKQDKTFKVTFDIMMKDVDRFTMLLDSRK